MSTVTRNGSAHRVLTANDKAEILALIHTRHEAGSGRDSAAARSWDATTGVSPFDSWETPIELESRDLKIEISHDRVLCHGFLRMSGIRKGLRKTVRFWLRETMSFERRVGGWQIVNEQRSVPFYTVPGLRPDVHSSSKLRVAWAS